MRHALDRIFKDKEGRIVIAQRPNLPLIIALLAALAAYTHIGPSSLGHWLRIVACGALLAWCLLELFYGVNYFRRLLGVVVLFVLLSMALRA